MNARFAAATAAVVVGLAAYIARRSMRLRAAGHVLRGHAVIYRMRITGNDLDLSANGRVPRYVYDTWLKDPSRVGARARLSVSSAGVGSNNE